MHTATLHNNASAYTRKLDTTIARSHQDAAPLKGKKLVIYHPDLIYLAERFGMVPFGTIEIRPGVDPTPSHVANLIERMRRAHVDVVVRELSYPANLAATVAQETGAKLVELPSMAGGVPGGADYRSCVDYCVRTMVKAVTAGWGRPALAGRVLGQ